LLVAHDGSATLLEPPSSSNPYANIKLHSAEDDEIIRRVALYTDKQVRIVRIKRTTEALVSKRLLFSLAFQEKIF